MDEQKLKFYVGVTVLCVACILIIVVCVVCKYCISSKKMQRWIQLLRSGDNQRRNQAEVSSNKKLLVSDESHLILKIQQGNYVGYEALEKDMTNGKLPSPVSQVHNSSCNKISALNNYTQVLPEHQLFNEDDIDMQLLKQNIKNQEASKLISRSRTTHMNNNHPHGFRNNYTIYEEGSDLSESEQFPDAEHLPEVDNIPTADKYNSDGSSHTVTQSSSSVCLTLDQSFLEQHACGSRLGQVEYSMEYNRENKQLVLQIIQANHLELSSILHGDEEKLDCFIKLFATNSNINEPKKQTKICKATCNPIFKESFLFRITEEQLSDSSITIQVYVRDRYARQRLLGELNIDLSVLRNIDYYKTRSNIVDYDHQPVSSTARINIGLQYNVQTQVLLVMFNELAALKLKSYGNTCEVSILTTLLDESTVIDRKKTAPRLMDDSSHAISFNPEIVSFQDISQNSVQSFQLLVQICQLNRDNIYDTMGYVLLGPKAFDAEYGHWVLISSGRTVEPIFMWHSAQKPRENIAMTNSQPYGYTV